jgi:O-antigen ligase
MYFAAAFALFCLVCSVLAFTRHPIYGLYFYLATTFVFPPDRWWGKLLPDLRWALLSAAVTALAVLLHRGKLKPKPSWVSNAPAVLFLIYALWMVVQTPWALDLEEHQKATEVLIKCLLACWFVYRIVDTKERLRDLMLGHVVGCAFLGVLAFFTGRQGGRLDGVGGPNLNDSNTLGMYLATAAVIGVVLVLTQRGWRRYLSLGCLLFIVEGFVLANSRGAFLGFAAGAIVLWFCKTKEYRKTFWAFAIVGALGLAALVDQVFIERMFTIRDATSESEEADTSARSRLVIIKAQVEMFLDYPMGTGRHGTAVLSPQYMDDRWLTVDQEGNSARGSHNTFMTALVEQGVPGALLFSAILAWVLVSPFRVRNLNHAGVASDLTMFGAGLAGALMAVMVSGMTADYLYKEVQYWLFPALVTVFWLGKQPASLVRPTEPAAATPAVNQRIVAPKPKPEQMRS